MITDHFYGIPELKVNQFFAIFNGVTRGNFRMGNYVHFKEK